MKVDFQQIAQALSISRPSVVMRAQRENWPFTTEAVRGGQRKVFDTTNLPSAIGRTIERQLSIQERGAGADKVLRLIAKIKQEDTEALAEKQAKGEANLKRLMDDLAPGVQARFDGRYEIVKSWERFWASVQPMGKKKSFEVYLEAFNAGESDVSAPVHSKFAPISSRTLYRWVMAFEREGMAGLIDHMDGKALKDVNVITKNPHLEATTVALLLSRPHITMKTLTEMLSQAAVDRDTGEVLFENPSYWAVSRFVNGWKNKKDELFMAATNPDEWKNKKMLALGDASEDVVRLNQRWEMDATPADWMLLDEFGGQRRYSVSVIIDVYSSRAVMVISPTPRAETHKLALRLAILAWGVPEEVVTDNGKDYVSREFLDVLKMLDIAHRRTNPFSPWEKPHVERMNQTMLHSVLEVYGSFIGHNVAERSAIEARTSFAERLFKKDKTANAIEIAMPAPLLQSRLNQWLQGVYEQRPHGGERMEGLSPFAKAAAYTGEIRQVHDERALDVLLAPPAGKGSYVITKKGLTIQGAQFIALEMGVMVGKTVQVYLTEDYGTVVLYHEGQFVCTARCPERTGISRQEIASHAKQLQRKNIAEQRKAIKVTKVDADALVSSYLQDKATQAGKLAALPKPSTPHTTKALSAAGEAARTLRGDVAATAIPADLQRLIDKRKAEQAAPVAPQESMPSNVKLIPDTAELRFRKWLGLDDIIQNGGTIDDPKLAKWHSSYTHTPEFPGQMRRWQESNAINEKRNTAATVLRLNNGTTNTTN